MYINAKRAKTATEVPVFTDAHSSNVHRNFFYIGSQGGNDYLPQTRHSDRGNFAFLDGHVGTMSAGELRSSSMLISNTYNAIGIKVTL